MSKLGCIFLWTCAASVVLSVAALTYLMFFEPPFLSYPGLPFKVAAPARPGESVQLQVTRCNSDKSKRTYQLSHTLVSVDTGRYWVLPAGIVSIKPGCASGVSAANVVPIGTPPGVYVVEGYAEVQGTIRTFDVHWYSEPFRVMSQ